MQLTYYDSVLPLKSIAIIYEFFLYAKRHSNLPIEKWIKIRSYPQYCTVNYILKYKMSINLEILRSLATTHVATF